MPVGQAASRQHVTDHRSQNSVLIHQGSALSACLVSQLMSFSSGFTAVGNRCALTLTAVLDPSNQTIYLVFLSYPSYYIYTVKLNLTKHSKLIIFN